MNVCLSVLDNVYIFEFAVEFGFLRMSPKTRRRLNISTQLVLLGECIAVIIVIMSVKFS